MTRQAVERQLGEADRVDGPVSAGAPVLLSYPDLMVTIRDDVVVGWLNHAPDRIETHITAPTVPKPEHLTPESSIADVLARIGDRRTQGLHPAR